MNRILLSLGCCLFLVSAANAKEPVKVGQSAPDITLTGIDGKQFKLSDVTGSGKNVALIFSRAHW